MARETDRAEGCRIAPARRSFTDRTGMIDTPTVVRILDLVGTFVFAISGAVAAVNGRLDIFGILVLSFVAGNFGGIGRDVLIGAVPPGALTDVRYLLVSVLAGVITFFRYAGVDRLRNPVLLFDAAGLSLFAVSGAQKAIDFGLDPVMAALLGMLNSCASNVTVVNIDNGYGAAVVASLINRL